VIAYSAYLLEETHVADQLRTIHLAVLLVVLILFAAAVADQTGPVVSAYDDAVKVESLAANPQEFAAVSHTLLDSEVASAFGQRNIDRSMIDRVVAAKPFLNIRLRGMNYTFDRRTEFLMTTPV
jgi:hypothetical protein